MPRSCRMAPALSPTLLSTPLPCAGLPLLVGRCWLFGAARPLAPCASVFSSMHCQGSTLGPSRSHPSALPCWLPAGAVLSFVERNTAHIEGVGDVCSLAAFDFQARTVGRRLRRCSCRLRCVWLTRTPCRRPLSRHPTPPPPYHQHHQHHPTDATLCLRSGTAMRGTARPPPRPSCCAAGRASWRRASCPLRQLIQIGSPTPADSSCCNSWRERRRRRR